MKSIVILGLMSGTSLDGLDLCLVDFKYDKEWSFSILKTDTVEYPNELLVKLKEAIKLNGLELSQLDIDLGLYFGDKVNDFIDDSAIKPNYIASHGHTIFHQPNSKLTLQIGNGTAIHSKTNIPVVNDFRTLDVLLGGQGAPLVPIGDKLLFNEYSICINLGGIANLSFNKEGERKAYDICTVNMALNELANAMDLDFDRNGDIARSGELIQDLYDQLNSLDFFNLDGPKSLGIEWYKENIKPLLNNNDWSLANRMHTFCHHIAFQIGREINKVEIGQVLITGGGAYHQFLIELIKKQTDHEIIIPTPELVEFKEALIFAFLSVLKVEGHINVLKSVTGAKRDSSSGTIITSDIND